MYSRISQTLTDYGESLFNKKVKTLMLNVSATEAGVRGLRKMPVAASGETRGTHSDIHVLFGGTSRFTNIVALE